MRINSGSFRVALTVLTLLVLFSASGATPASALPTSWYVDDDNCPGPGSGTRDDPFCAIQDAIDAALPGDIVRVAKGIYTESLSLPTENFTMVVSDVADEAVAFDVSDDVPEEPKINPNPTWRVNTTERLSACDNRPGLKMIYIKVLDERGEPLQGVKVRFDVEPSQGIAYDHPNVWGVTDENGYLEWDSLGKPTRYLLWMEDDGTPLVENVRTDLGNEYCCPEGSWSCSWRPVNRPGIYSYRIEIQRKGEGG